MGINFLGYKLPDSLEEDGVVKLGKLIIRYVEMKKGDESVGNGIGGKDFALLFMAQTEIFLDRQKRIMHPGELLFVGKGQEIAVCADEQETAFLSFSAL